MRTISPRITRSLALTPVVCASLSLIGWQFRISLLRADFFGSFIAPNTALCFVLCGVSIFCQSTSVRALRVIGIVLGTVVAAFALATAMEYILGASFGIDRLFFAHRLSDWSLPLPGRFAFNTALAFIFAGVSLITLHRTSGPSIAEVSGGLVLIVFYLAIVGRAYSASALYSRVMSPYTAVLFGFLGAALLCASARHAFVDTAISPEAGGIVFRRMLVAVLILMPLLGLMRVQLERRGLISPELSTPMFVIITVAVFTVLTLHTATLLNNLDRRREQTEQVLLRTEKLATAGRMAATVAHEINNPLEAVTNLLYLLNDGKADATVQREYIRLAQQELARVSAITRRTLGFYREERNATDIDLGKTMDDILQLYARRLEGANVAVSRCYAKDALVHAPEGEMRQVLTNLLSNAIDALPLEHPRIDITLAADKDVVFTFADNGTGISEANLSRLFEPFFTTKRDIGNGLGLWVTKTLVERNGGHVELTSHTDGDQRGTVFRLTFPRAMARSEGASKSAAQQVGAAD